jgi:hypothetical protein
MATTSTRQSIVIFSGDVVESDSRIAATNTASPGQTQLITTASGANTITVPTGGSVPTAVTIVPPAGNANTIILKGVTGDTGVSLHLTDPTIVALNASVTTFVLTTGGIITGLRLIWS